jgi:hypothetical protein
MEGGKRMTRRKKLLIGGALVLALSAGGVGYAQAGGDDDENVTGPDAERAKQAAVAVAGGGRAVGVEREDEGNAAWEVEVQRDGRTVEVKLTGHLRRAGVETDDDSGSGTENENGDQD